MDTFKERLISEQTELAEKLTKLNAFNQSEKVKELSKEQQNYLSIQAGAMFTYNECLIARLDSL